MLSAAIYKSFLSKAGGAGSRGGHVIGHTRSGKPIYARWGSSNTALADKYGHFTAQDHRDAADAHKKASQTANDSGGPSITRHSFHAAIHKKIASSMAYGEGKSKEHHQWAEARHRGDQQEYTGRKERSIEQEDANSMQINRIQAQASGLLAAHHHKMAKKS